MKVGLDTSVVVRLLVGVPPEQTAVAWRLVEELASADNPARVDDLVIAEAFFVLQHHYLVSLEDTVAALAALVSDPRIMASGVSARVLETSGRSTENPGFVDRLIHRRYLDEGATLATFDKAAGRLPKARRLA